MDCARTHNISKTYCTAKVNYNVKNVRGFFNASGLDKTKIIKIYPRLQKKYFFVKKLIYRRSLNVLY